MQIFIAGDARKSIERARALHYDRRILFYVYCTDRFWEQYSSMCDELIANGSRMKKVELFLDSGAFSAWSKGVEIKIEDYIAFIKKHHKYISVYAVLDVIGDPMATLKNQHIMEDAGLSPIPCFHFGEPFSFLKRYIEEYDYIALGGIAMKRTSPEMFIFLDQCFNLICDGKGIPRVKVHGFGVTTMQAMIRYPWYSVDSTSWLVTSRMGRIFVPRKLPDGGWDYLDTLPGKSTRKIAVSTISPAFEIPDQHISTLSKQWQAEVHEWLEMHDTKLGRSRFRRVPPGYELREGERWAKKPGVGELEGEEKFGFGKPAQNNSKEYIEIVEEPGVSNNYVERDIINAKYFKELESKFPEWPWAWKRPSLHEFGF